jgi:hypothetical protein
MIVARHNSGLGQDAPAGSDLFSQAMSMWQVFAFGLAAFVLYAGFMKGKGR